MEYRAFTKSVTTPVSDYKQYAPPWGAWPMHCGGTVKALGCCFCSSADVLNVSPVELYRYLYPLKGDCPFNWYLVQRKYNVNFTRYGDSTSKTAFNILKKQMFDFLYNQGKPLLVYMKNYNTNKEHWVVAVGFNGTLPVITAEGRDGYPDTGAITSSMFLIKDPGSSTTKTLADVLTRYGDVRSFRIMAR